LPIVNSHFGLASAAQGHMAISDRESKVRRPTRYREVVLTSLVCGLRPSHLER